MALAKQEPAITLSTIKAPPFRCACCLQKPPTGLLVGLPGVCDACDRAQHRWNTPKFGRAVHL